VGGKSAEIATPNDKLDDKPDDNRMTALDDNPDESPMINLMTTLMTTKITTQKTMLDYNHEDNSYFNPV
jgi:hypothetical protein